MDASDEASLCSVSGSLVRGNKRLFEEMKDHREQPGLSLGTQKMIAQAEKMHRIEEMEDQREQPQVSLVTQKLIAQAEKIHMFRRMMGFGNRGSTNTTKIYKRHSNGIEDFLSVDVTLGEATNTWKVSCSESLAGSFLVSHVWGTDFLCDCIDYPSEYVCKECKICIHMYTCSCGEVDDFPALICKHIHAVVQFGEGVVQKPDIYKHVETPHRSPGHKWPNPIIYRFNIKCGKRGSAKTLVPVSSESVIIDDLESGRYELPNGWDSDERKDEIAQEQIKNDIMETAISEGEKDIAIIKEQMSDPEYQMPPEAKVIIAQMGELTNKFLRSQGRPEVNVFTHNILGLKFKPFL